MYFGNDAAFWMHLQVAWDMHAAVREVRASMRSSLKWFLRRIARPVRRNARCVDVAQYAPCRCGRYRSCNHWGNTMRMDARCEVLVLGIGNVLWADEGFGVRAVEALHAAVRVSRRRRR